MQGLPIETERLILREIMDEDADGLFLLDSDPRVHEFLGKNPLKEKEEVYGRLKYIKDQYKNFGMGRLAMIEKSTGDFMGWTGIKMEPIETNGYKDYYDLGYRMIPKFWGKGYATESAIASVRYGFEVLGLKKINGAAHYQNIGSNKVLMNSGLKFVEDFIYDGAKHNWYELNFKDWKHENT